VTEKIQQYLSQIESENDIEILLACETGSRAWGFPSPDSDYDVRFIYKHKHEWYLTLGEQKDTIEAMFEQNDFDLSGWDIRKSLQLLRKSNPPLLERLQSPIQYRVREGFLEELLPLAQQQYSKIATMHHYFSMSRKIFAEFGSEQEVKLKKLFYALRTAVACKWILERPDMPPIDFHIMMSGLEIPVFIKDRIQSLISLKSTQPESYLHPAEPEINEYISDLLNRAEKQAQSLPAGKGSYEDLQHYFRRMVLSK
jgi:predicted nucleotidyltransferase